MGCIFCCQRDASTAQLRILLVEPWARGLGIGSRLVEVCTSCAAEAGYDTIVLWTNDVLVSARRIYEAAGFRLVDEERHHKLRPRPGRPALGAGAALSTARRRAASSRRASSGETPVVSLTLLDWRRQVFDLYREVRASADPSEAHGRWCDVRRELFRHHPDSPLPRRAVLATPARSSPRTTPRSASSSPRSRPSHRSSRSRRAPTGSSPSTGSGGWTSRASARSTSGGCAAYGGGVFVPLKDARRQAATTLRRRPLPARHGQGRRPRRRPDDRLVVDLNFAYNPSCAYDPGLGVPAAAAGQRRHRGRPRGRADRAVERGVGDVGVRERSASDQERPWRPGICFRAAGRR